MAITTLYRGIEYRSRLEARWASFFHNIGWHTTYEPFDGDGYIPDFLVHGEAPLLIEVKPAVTLGEYQAATAKADSGLTAYNYDVLIVGADPLPHFANTFSWSNAPAGWLGETGYPEGRAWGVGNWATCGFCHQYGVFHDVMTYSIRPCGHYEGDHYLRGMDNSTIQDAWASACNDVKWRGRDAAPKPAPTAAIAENYRPLQKVHHTTFGDGLVLKVNGTGDAEWVEVDFGLREGTKKLLTKYVREIMPVTA